MNKKIITITVMVASLVLIGIGCSQKKTTNQNENLNRLNVNLNANVSVQPVNTNQDETADWQIYTNDTYSYQVKYPADWYYHPSACCPPPPANIRIANVADGVNTPPYANVLISALTSAGDTLENNSEIASLVDDGYTKTEITVSGQKAYKLERRTLASDNGGSIYIYYKGYFYRLDYGATDLDVYTANQDILDKIINTFKFI